MAKKKITVAKAEQVADTTKLADVERWQATFAAGECLPPRVPDKHGLTNKDYTFRLCVLAIVASETLATSNVLAVCGGYSRSKASSYLRRWRKIVSGEMSPDSSVPKASAQWAWPKSKASATRQANELSRQYKASCKACHK